MNSDTINKQLDVADKTSISLPSDSDDDNRDGSVTSSVGKQRISSSRKRVIDETLLPPDEAEKLESRRAYNRECATRARKRTKTLVSQLQDEVKSLQSDKEDLRRENAVLKAQLDGFEKQNQSLLYKNVMADPRLGVASGPAFFQPRVTLGDALSEMRMASLAGRDSAASRARLMFPTATQNLLAARFPGGMP